MNSKKGLKLKRAWLILKLEGTNKIVVLKRSKKSNNKGQWDFIGGSSKRRKLDPRKLIRKESHEEIGFKPPFLTPQLSVVAKFSIYHYYTSVITLKELVKLRLSKEHCKIKIVSMHKLRHHKGLHHSIRIFLKN